MKKLLSLVLPVVTLVMMFTINTPAYAGDADGLWYGTDYSGGPLVGMTRENSGFLLYTFLDCYKWTLPDWFPIFGPFDGTTGNLSLLLTSEANGNIPQSLNVTFTLTSPSTSTLTVNSCINFPGQDNCPPNGTVVNLTKIF